MRSLTQSTDLNSSFSCSATVMPGRGILCQAYGCSNRNVGTALTPDGHRIRFHKFPRNEEICKKWVINLRNASLDSLQYCDLQKTHRRVCSIHFEDSQYYSPSNRHSSSYLLPSAVPTILNVPNPPPQTSRRKSPVRRNSIRKTAGKQDISPPHECVGCEPSLSSDSETIKILKRKNRNLQSVIQKKAKTIKRLQRELAVSKTSKLNNSKHLLSKLPDKVKLFCETQLRACDLNKTRWKQSDLQFALGLKFRSTSAYKYLLSQGFSLPSVRTLQRSVENVCVNSGPCATLVSYVTLKIEAMNPCDRIATLSMDAMKISPSLRYEENRDLITGFEDIGNIGRSPKVADEGLVPMLRGVRSKWKQPLGYYLIRHSVKQNRFLHIINDCLVKCHQMGVMIICFVCDQETTQFALLKSQGVSMDHPYLVHPSTGEKVFVVIDIPHCLKNTRNALFRRHDINYGSGTASWRHIEQLFELENNMHSELRLVPKLKSIHLNLPVGKNMKVSIAAQTCSYSVARAIRTYVHFEKMPYSALATAKFCEEINNLFDVLNSSSTSAKGYKQAATVENWSSIRTFLLSMRSWIAQWKFVKDNRVKTTMPFTQAWQISISGIIGIVDHLFENEEFKFVSIRRFSQDHLENLFSVIRGHNGPNDHPEFHHFKSAVRICAVTQLLRPLSSRSNCADDGDDVLLGTEMSFRKTGPESELDESVNLTIKEDTVDEVIRSVLEDDNSVRFNCIQVEALAYIGGFILHKLKTESVCEECYASLADSRVSVFIKHMNFDFSTRGLLQPSPAFLRALCDWEKAFMKNVSVACHLTGVMAYLKSVIPFHLLNYVLSCHCENLHTKIATLFLRIRLHHHCKVVNQKMSSVAVQNHNKGRKLKKLIS